jgi:hypothetical protein
MKVPNWTRVSIEHVNKFGRKHSLREGVAKDLALHLLSEGYESGSECTHPQYIGCTKNSFGYWVGLNPRWTKPIKMKRLIWMAAPEWATELRFGNGRREFYWVSDEYCQRFSAPNKSDNNTIRSNSRLISTRPGVAVDAPIHVNCRSVMKPVIASSDEEVKKLAVLVDEMTVHLNSIYTQLNAVRGVMGRQAK